MRRFECTTDGTGKFWEVDVEATSLTTRWGRLGTTGQSKTKTFADRAAALAEMNQLIRDKTGKGYVETAASSARFPGVTERALKSLGTKISKLDDDYRIGKALEKASGEYAQRAPLAWHLVIHGFVDAASHDALLDFLAESEVDEAKASALAALLVRRSAAGESKRSQWFPGWTTQLDALAYRAYCLAPAAFAAHEKDYSEQVRLGLAFVRGRRAEPIAAEVGRQIIRHLAERQATGYGISGSVAALDADGHETTLDVNSPAGLRELALRFGSEAEWDAGLQAACLQNCWGLIENVRPALEQLPLASLSRLLATRGHQRLLSDSSDAMTTMLAILERRSDSPDALLATPEELPESEADAATVRELYAVTAVRRLVAQGLPVPASALDVLGRFELLRTELSADAMLEALRAFPAERVLSKVKQALPGAWDKAPIAALGAHFDASILEGVLASDGYVSDEFLGYIGAPVVEALGRTKRYEAMVRAMARAVAGAALPPASWDEYLEIREGVSEPLERVLLALPPERRDRVIARGLNALLSETLPFLHLAGDAVVDEGIRLALRRREMPRQLLHKLGQRAIAPLTRHIGECQGDAEVMETLKRSLSSESLARLLAAGDGVQESKQAALSRIVTAAQAAAPESARVRMYLIEESDEHHPARAGSLSRIGGQAPGIDEASNPKDDDGEPLEHLLTLDVADIPELSSKYPGARAIALFCPEPDTGARTEETQIVAIPRAAAAALPNSGRGEQALAIYGIDVPLSVFERDRPPEIERLRQSIWKAGAHVFGRPLWIQAFDGDDDGLLIQINDGLVPELNLGDVGSLYVFENGYSVFHCH